MFIKEIIKGEKIRVSIPLTRGSEKIRIKKRPITNDYGMSVATRSKPLTNSCYVEWQIGYDIIIKDKEKIKLTTLPNLIFVGANGAKKTLYELSEYIKYFYDWEIITKDELLKIKTFLEKKNLLL